MKKINIISFVSLLVAVIILSSCSGLKKMQKNAGLVEYKVTPQILEMHADSVAVGITVNYPAKYFNKKAIVEATPVLKWQGGEKAFKMQTVQGEKVEENNPVISYAGGNFSYSDKISYDEAMRVSELNINIKGKIKKKELEFDPIKIGDGVIATPGIVKIDPRPILGKDAFQRIIPESKNGAIYFAIQQSNIRNTELTSVEMKALKEYIKEAKENERKEFKGVSISSYASPDGPLDLNTGLATKRGDVSTDFVKKEFGKDEAVKNENFFSKASTPEDWEGFKTELQASDLADKDIILRVLSMHSDPEVREKDIKNMAKTYLDLANKVLPKLRRSKLAVNVDLVGYSDEELKQIFSVKPDSLKVEELLYTATLYTDNNQKLKVYQSCAEIYKEDWRGPNNVGYAYVNLGKISEAKTAFENAKKIASNNIILNNLGVCALHNKDIQGAEEFFKSATGAGSEVNYNMGIVKIKQADYQSAVTSFGSDCSFNAGLAKLLNGDNDGAVKAVDCASDKESAWNFYLKAVAGARSANTDLMYNSLRAAVSKDASLNNFAKTDMEFFKYFNDDTFKSIVK
ncbi:MAG: hypothetical protein ABIJ97_17120 [Bacteroidota bacterium]